MDAALQLERDHIYGCSTVDAARPSNCFATWKVFQHLNASSKLAPVCGMFVCVHDVGHILTYAHIFKSAYTQLRVCVHVWWKFVLYMLPGQIASGRIPFSRHMLMHLQMYRCGEIAIINMFMRIPCVIAWTTGVCGIKTTLTTGILL